MKNKKFPVLAVLLLIFASTWFLSELGYFKINLPWIPLILIVVSVAWIFNRYAK